MPKYQPLATNSNITSSQTRVSDENSSNALLLAGEEFVGEWTSILEFAELDITQTTDVPGTLFIDGSDDGGVTTVATFPFPGITTLTLRSPLSRQFFRVRFLNGPTPQTRNNLQTLLRPITPGASALPIESPTFPQTIAQTTRAVLTAKNTAGTYSNIQMGQKPKDESLPVTMATDQPPMNVMVTVSSLPLPTGAATESTLAAIKAKTDNLDTQLSTRTKPTDQQHVVVDTPVPVTNSNVDVALSTRASEATLQLVKENTDASSFHNRNTAGTATLKSGAGVLRKVIVNNTTGATTLTLYNNTAASGAKIATINIPVQSKSDPEPVTLDYGVKFTIGLTIVQTGTDDVTITYI